MVGDIEGSLPRGAYMSYTQGKHLTGLTGLTVLFFLTALTTLPLTILTGIVKTSTRLLMTTSAYFLNSEAGLT